jgi:hypothetical protein
VKKHLMVIALAIAALGAAVTTKPATRRSGADRAAVRAAVTALGKEFAADKLRPACTYFKDVPAKDISDTAILDELTAPFSNARLSAYVRWQLLSGLSDEPDANMMTRLLAAYRGAPTPFARPGIAVSEQQKLDQFVRGKQLVDEADVKRQAALIFEAAAKQNQPILAYRDELYRRLPKDLNTIAAALTDLSYRMSVVADGKELVKMFARDVQEWATTKGSPRQLAAVAEAVRKLADSKGPYYYSTPSWRQSSRSFGWTNTRTGIDSGDALEDLADALDEQSRQPPLTLEK